MPACDLDSWLINFGFPARGYNATVKNQTTPLMKASLMRDAAIVHLLLQHGADVNARDSDGNNALWFGKAEVLSQLTHAGANLRLETLDGFSALDMAATIECLTLLRRALETPA